MIDFVRPSGDDKLEEAVTKATEDEVADGCVTDPWTGVRLSGEVAITATHLEVDGQAYRQLARTPALAALTCRGGVVQPISNDGAVRTTCVCLWGDSVCNEFLPCDKGSLVCGSRGGADPGSARGQPGWICSFLLSIWRRGHFPGLSQNGCGREHAGKFYNCVERKFVF